MPTIDGGGPSGPGSPSYPATATGEIIGLAALQIQDITGATWDENTVLIPYLNLAILEIIGLKPEAYPISKVLALAAGPVQALPSGDLALIDLKYNLTGSASPYIPGEAIRPVDKALIDDKLPTWMTDSPSDTVSFVISDDRDPKVYYVYPPQPTSPSPSNHVMALVSTPPTELDDVDDTFPLDDSYKVPCIDYIVYRVLIEETTIPNAQAKAGTFLQKFYQDLGIKTAAEGKSAAKGK
jgi:hypothetical protein